LYGRASAQIHLQPFYFGSTRSFFPNYSAVDRVALYSIFGGVPAYWERVDSSKSISWNIKRQLLTSNNLLQSETRLLLQDFISDPHNYLSILSAIANGAHISKEISEITGLPSGHVSKYLGVLTETGFAERRVPVTEPGPSRAGRYHITDPYLRFYFRFLADRQDQLALGAHDIALAEITRHMIDFIGRYTWEELCREWVLRASAFGDLPVMLDHIGSAWNSKVQIDVAGINSMEKTVVLGECKWTLSKSERKVVADLIEERAARIIPERGKWRVYFLGFSRSGWTSGALAYQHEINQHPIQGENWESIGLRLVTLDELDDNMTKWTK
jgi:AAA+ ATPase superfamily predicted ATPase